VRFLLLLALVACERPTHARVAAALDAGRPPLVMDRLVLEKIGQVEGIGTSVAYAPDGKTWVTGEQRVVGVYEGLTRVRQLENVWVGTGDRIRFSSDGQRLLIGAAIYSFTDGKPVFGADPDDLLGHKEEGWGLEDRLITSDEKQLLVAFRYHPSRCCRDKGHRDSPSWEPPSLVALATVPDKQVTYLGKVRGVYGAKFAHNTKVLAVHHMTTVELLDRATLAPVASVKRDFGFYELAFSADGGALVGSRGGTIVVMDGTTLAERAAWEVRPEGTWPLAMHPTLPMFATCGWDGLLRLYSLDGKELASLQVGKAVALAWHPSGEELVLSAPDYPKSYLIRVALRSR
jgi:hypothetical protein